MKLISFIATILCAGSLWASNTIEIQPGPVPHDQYQTFYFGRVWVGQRPSVVYNLQNQGETPLRIQRITIGGMFFDANSNCPDVLPPQGRCQTRIYYWPQFEGHHHGELIWFTDDGNLHLSLWGEAYRP